MVFLYNKANKKVAELCIHQKGVSKTHDSQMEKIEEQIKNKNAMIKEFKIEIKAINNDTWDTFVKKKMKRNKLKSKPSKRQPETIKKRIGNIKDQIDKLEMRKTLKDDTKNIALGTSKINYMDPRITVAYAEKYNIPLDKLFSKALLSKFKWAIETDKNYKF